MILPALVFPEGCISATIMKARQTWYLRNWCFWLKNFLIAKLLILLHIFLPEIFVKKVILHEWSEQSECSEVKGIKKSIKKFHPSVYVCEGMCLPVCLCVCRSYQIKKLNNFWLKVRILIKFSGPVQLLTSNFCVGLLDQLASSVQPWAKNGQFR